MQFFAFQYGGVWKAVTFYQGKMQQNIHVGSRKCQKVGRASYFGRVSTVLVLTTWYFALCDTAFRTARFYTVFSDGIFWGATFALIKNLAILNVEKLQGYESPYPIVAP